MSRKERKRGLTSIEDFIDASIQGREDYIKKAKKDKLQQPENTKNKKTEMESKTAD